MTRGCPRCREQLDSHQISGFDVRLCTKCHGLLISHAELSHVIETSWRGVAREIVEKEQFHLAQSTIQELHFTCSDCGKQMERYGYLGYKAIQIDRCDPCNLVWLDADELQNMILALAKDNYRTQSNLERERKDQLSLASGAMPPASYHAGNWLYQDSRARRGVPATILLELLLR